MITTRPSALITAHVSPSGHHANARTPHGISPTTSHPSSFASRARGVAANSPDANAATISSVSRTHATPTHATSSPRVSHARAGSSSTPSATRKRRSEITAPPVVAHRVAVAASSASRSSSNAPPRTRASSPSPSPRPRRRRARDDATRQFRIGAGTTRAFSRRILRRHDAARAG